MKRLIFNWKAQNAHGLHSPLIFKLYSEVINPCYQEKGDFEIRLYQELCNFFQTYKLSTVEVIKIEDSIDLANSSALFVVPNIRSQAGQDAWKEVIQAPQVIFSVELYELGLLFMFPKAPKQHFILKKS